MSGTATRRVWASPDPRLSPLVGDYRCYLDPGGSGVRCHVPADDPTLIFNLAGALEIRDPDGESRTLGAGEVYLGGIQTAPAATTAREAQSAVIVGISPAAAHRLLGGLPMHELRDRSVLVDGVREVGERLAGARDDLSRFAIVDAFLCERMADRRECPDTSYAWTRLVRSRGRLGIGALASELGWTRKRLAVRFREYVGINPKTAARLLRFHHAMQLAETRRMAWADIALSCGFADQAHLSREVRAFTGAPPRDLSFPEEGANLQDAWLDRGHHRPEAKEASP